MTTTREDFFTQPQPQPQLFAPLTDAEAHVLMDVFRRAERSLLAGGDGEDESELPQYDELYELMRDLGAALDLRYG